MADIFNDLKAMLERLKNEAGNLMPLIEGSAKEVSIKCNALDVEIDNLLQSSLASPEKWAENKDKQADIIKKVQKDLPERIQGIRGGLKQIQSGMFSAVKEARQVIITGIIFLIITAGFYTALHYCPKIPSYNKAHAADFFNSIGKVKASIVKPEIVPAEVIGTLSELKSEDDVLTSEFSERVSFLKGFVSTFKTDEKISQNDQRVVEIKEEIARIEKRARGLAQNDRFFWISGYWRWLEIVFWGEFGVIVGILVWVSTQVEGGKYTRLMYEQERHWYLTEAVIGPIVVVAVFFILKQFIGTLIEGITEEDVGGSIYTTLGLSFTLGLFLRRTLGIFDFIKDRLPLPKS
ncbi:MAG: hypothetical protein HZB80_01380 [Deltaproteobacteria bacterium]|nr:hypothetical protein [Deltaproteobacteria bacterium]